MITKFINPLMLFGWMQGKKSGKLENQAGAGTSPVTPVEVHEIPSTEIKKTIKGSMVTFEGTYQGKPIRVRILNENKGGD